MWLMLQHDFPDDFVISMNETRTVREFVEKAFKIKGIIIKWRGSGIDEVGYSEENNKVLIKVSQKYFRPSEVDVLIGDSTKAMSDLGWRPKITFDELVNEMVLSDSEG
jgi:GDPmannose 4,6-dehydratase